MQIRPLQAFAINPQLGMKGSVVNIPIEVNDMAQTLPRNFDNMSTIQIKLKRHITHQTNYMYESIRPKSVCDALKHLVKTPLYRKYNIDIDQKYLNMYERQTNKTIEFIIDGNDAVTFENDITDDVTNCYLNTTENSTDEEDDDEVMIVDRNKEAASHHIQVIAPGQNKNPVPWHMQPDIEELSFPRIYGGVPFTSVGQISYADRAKSEARRYDRRSCVPTKVLYMAKKKLELACISNINVCLRKKKGWGRVDCCRRSS